MTQHIAALTLVARDYDEAIEFYVDRLGFDLTDDRNMGSGKRWVTVAPAGSATRLLLAQAVGVGQDARIGNQTGGRVGFFLHTSDFQGDYERFRQNGVRFLEAPRNEAYGMVAVFEDLYGNKWDLIQPAGRPG
jgi:predicted enzyme related to lactoylglutathione lyase